MGALLVMCGGNPETRTHSRVHGRNGTPRAPGWHSTLSTLAAVFRSVGRGALGLHVLGRRGLVVRGAVRRRRRTAVAPRRGGCLGVGAAVWAGLRARLAAGEGEPEDR